MNLIPKGQEHKHRGIIGIESAIVLIAFVIVAAALAFVVLNMGFATTQKAKTSIVATLQEAGSSLEISGKVIGFSALGGPPTITAIGIPIKIASGGESVNLDAQFASVKYTIDLITYDDIYDGVSAAPALPVSLETGLTACTAFARITSNPIIAADSATTGACVYFTVDDNNNFILDAGEHAMLALVIAPADQPQSLDKVKIELVPPSGATLTVERNIPNISTSFVDLG
jgi:flagellin FlaB